MPRWTHVKPVYAKLGSVSHGTMRPEDLIPCLCEEYLALFARTGRRTVSPTVRRVRRIAKQFDRENTEYDFFTEGFLNESLEFLFDAMQEYAPPLASFGAHEGDGSDYGYWLADPDLTELAASCETPVYDDLAMVPEHYVGTFLIVNGNTSCYERTKNAEDTLHWSIV